MGQLDINRIMSQLSEERPFFVSERDFQVHLAVHLQSCNPNWNILTEFRRNVKEGEKNFVDIVIRNHINVAIELKYKTDTFQGMLHGHPVALVQQGATTDLCKSFGEDIENLETIRSRWDWAGVAILLTNEKSYWQKGKPGRRIARLAEQHRSHWRSYGQEGFRYLAVEV